jgi:transcriptional regulator with XRE-family HTH domain
MDPITDPHVASTGVPQLDAALGGLFWGDNVVWEVDESAPVAPFVAALLRHRDQFERVVLVRFDGEAQEPGDAYGDAEVLDARPGSSLANPGPLLSAVRARARQPRALVVFDSLDAVSVRWGDDIVTRFFARACPMLLDLWAIAYWSLTPARHSAEMRQAVDAITQCVLVLGADRLRIAKAEGRTSDVQGSVFRVQPNGPQAQLEQAPAAARLATALRAIRIQRHLSQGELAELAGVSASAISQAERGRRGLALDTLLQLSTHLNITIDELLRGEISHGYRLARRRQPGGAERLSPLLDDPNVGLRVQLSQLAPGESVSPDPGHVGVEVIAIAAGLVQVHLATGRPVLRQGEVLLVEWSGVTGWRNLGEDDALVFVVLRDDRGPSRSPPDLAERHSAPRH